MSGPKLISPLLDRFAMGDAITAHHGVCCYPAMPEDSDEKYIVKIISIPASQVQLDALLLTGAYPDKAAALHYFQELADSAVQEAELLKDLSRLDGFVSYDDWQVVPMDDGMGYCVYLLGSYKRSLYRHMGRNPMTHLEAINLGLDLCSALAACRRAGWLYVDLKPENVFITPNHTFQIGDLGFLSLDSLRYASLPERCRSHYTPPEIKDAFSTVHETADIYSLGLILYQAYNNGELPFSGFAPDTPLSPPMYADYEMSEIILKACAPDPADRWQDPSQLGQALVGYMQRNGATDTPIIPAPSPDSVVPPVSPITEENPDTEVTSEVVEDVHPVVPEDCSAEEPGGSDSPEEQTDDPADLSFLDDMVSDETAPDENGELDLDDAPLTEEMTEILAQAEDLISHETPDGVIPPEPIEVPMPEPISLEEPPLPDSSEEQPDSSPADTQGETAVDETDTASNILPEAESDAESECPQNVEDTSESTEFDTDPESESHPERHGKTLILILIILLLLGAAGFGGTYFYQNYYLQPIADLQLDGTRDQLSVTLDTRIPDEKLTVVCTDTYGIATRATVEDGVASFSHLNAATTYMVSLEIQGFHRLTGKTSTTYTTDAKTNVVSFTAVTGPTDGSVILNFTVDGPEPEAWTVSCTSDTEAARTISFTGHTVTIPDLTVAQTYTFTLIPSGDMYLDGTDTVDYQASQVLYAQNLRFESLDGNSLTLAWENPDGYDEMEWTVTHSNAAGEICSMATVTDTSFRLELDDLTQSNTFEILATGMTQSNKLTLSANPITVTGLSVDDSDYPRMYLQWSFEGDAPETGWNVSVTADGSEILEVLSTDTNSVWLEHVIPGAHYEFTVQAADGTTVFNSVQSYDAPEAERFDGFWITTSNIEVSMCRTPDLDQWTYRDLTADDYTDTFRSDEQASIVLHLNRSHADTFDQVITTIVIRDAAGVPVIVCSNTDTWYNMWYYRYCTIELDRLPGEPGEYLAELYFDGAVAGSYSFHIE